MGGFQLGKVARVLGVAVFATLTTFAFQNCSNGFTSAAGNLAAQCVQKVQAEKLFNLQSLKMVSCADSSRFACELRIFSPQVETGEEQSKICSGDFCTRLIKLTFNTASAQSLPGLEPSAFSPGGEYNRQEANCVYMDENFPVIREDSDDLQKALAGIRAKCQSAAEPL